MADSMIVRISEDGTIKTQADKISLTNHATAENILKVITTLAGGQTSREHTGVKQGHTHDHQHEHTQEHSH